MEPEEPACAGEIHGAFRAGAFSANPLNQPDLKNAYSGKQGA
jgi:hypothetical protein